MKPGRTKILKPSLLALLEGWKPLAEEFPDVDEGLLPPDDVEL